MPVLPEDRPIGSRWVYHGANHPRTPIGCEVVERYDDIEKCMHDCCIRCDDGSLVIAFDATLHAQGCSGGRDWTKPWFPMRDWATRNPPCACGAIPIHPEHKSIRLGKIKQKLQTKAEIEHEDLVVRFDGPIPVAVERKVS